MKSEPGKEERQEWHGLTPEQCAALVSAGWRLTQAQGVNMWACRFCRLSMPSSTPQEELVSHSMVHLRRDVAVSPLTERKRRLAKAYPLIPRTPQGDPAFTSLNEVHKVFVRDEDIVWLVNKALYSLTYQAEYHKQKGRERREQTKEREEHGEHE